MEGGLKIRMLLNKIKCPGVIFCSKYGLLFPPNIKINTIVGKGIKSDKIYDDESEPTAEEINSFHEKYLK